MRKTHIPDWQRPDRTYCGRLASKVECVDLLRQLIESATCKTCQASDDRRQLEALK